MRKRDQARQYVHNLVLYPVHAGHDVSAHVGLVCLLRWEVSPAMCQHFASVSVPPQPAFSSVSGLRRRGV